MNIGRAANSEPFHFNFDIGNAPYIRHVNQVQEIIWVFPRGVVKNGMAITNTDSNNPYMKY